MRVNDLEFIRNGDGERPPEIVQWSESPGGREFKFTILWYRQDREGYYIEFVGGRPLKYPSPEMLFDMMEYGQDVLMAEWRLKEKESYRNGK